MTHTSRRIGHVVGSIQEQRGKDRRRAFDAAHERHTDYSKRSGALAIGRDENGHVKETRRLESFRIIVDKWYVRMGFKREDQEKLKGNSWMDVEGRLKEWDVPRRVLRFNTHIITAVRALKHLKEGYEKEIRDTEQIILSALDTLNAWISESKRYTNSEIDKAIAQLTTAKEALEKKQVAVKCIVAVARLDNTIKMLEEAKKMQLGSREREMQVSRACAVFTSVRNRVGQWRDRQIAGIVEWNHQKECALRVERDQWLFSQLSRFAEAAEQVFEFQTYDQNKLRVLEGIRERIDQKKPKASILRYIKANSSLFRVNGRERKGAEDIIAVFEAGVARKEDGKRIDYLIGHYGWLYRFVDKGEKGKAKDKLDYLELFVNANKPRFILDELKKMPDKYLESVIAAMEKAVEAFEAEDFATAKNHFADARDRLKEIVYPNPT